MSEDGKIIERSMKSEVRIQSTKLLCSFDFCLLCGGVVFKGEWRRHLIDKHKIVTIDNPRDKDGKWKHPDILEYAT